MTIDDKVNSMPAVVLAGGERKLSLSSVRRAIEDLLYYGEPHLFLKRYKTLIPVNGNLNGKFGDHPLLLYGLHSLSEVERVPRIVVVGPKDEIMGALENAPFDTSKIEVIEQEGTMGQNIIKGYQQVGGRGHALIMTGDAPTTSTECIDDFLDIAPIGDYDIVLPVVKKSLMGEIERVFPRKHGYVDPSGIEPEEYIENGDLDSNGRVGLRLTSLAIANLEGIDSEEIDDIASRRKLQRRSVRKRLKRDINNLIGINMGYSDYLKIYRKGVPISWLAQLFTAYHGKTVQAVGLNYPAATLDVDSPFDVRAIRKYLEK